MSVKRLSYVLIASTLLSGCSTSQVLENWHTPSAWFGEDNNTADSNNPLDSDEVVVAQGDEGLKKSVASGNGDQASDAPLDDAIAPELRKQAREAREGLDDARSGQDSAASESELWDRLRAGCQVGRSGGNARVLG